MTRLRHLQLPGYTTSRDTILFNGMALIAKRLELTEEVKSQNCWKFGSEDRRLSFSL